MKAVINGIVVAEASEDKLIRIEGNYYFPPTALVQAVLKDSPTPYTCPWKGAAQYYDVATADGVHRDVAWSYPHPLWSAIQRVGADFSGYVAFDESQVAVG